MSFGLLKNSISFSVTSPNFFRKNMFPLDFSLDFDNDILFVCFLSPQQIQTIWKSHIIDAFIFPEISLIPMELVLLIIKFLYPEILKK